ncbi:hypothetical protein D9M69_436790 [compost metagenome]
MIHHTSEAFGQPQLQCSYKAQQGLIGIGETDLRQEKPDALAGEFAIEKHALLGIGLGILALGTPCCMVAVELLGLPFPLQSAAFGTDTETRPIQLLTPDLHRSPLLRLLTKVHFPEGHSVQEFKAEGECLLVNRKGLAHCIRRAIDQCLADIEAALALVRVIGNATVSIERTSKYSGQAQHFVHPPTVFP